MDPANEEDATSVERVQGGFHVVIDGHINPMILLPNWFGREGLLREEEVQSANRELKIGPDFVAFNTGGMSFVASQQTLEVFSNNEGHAFIIRDLIESVFTLLSHTPLKTLTISRSSHFGATVGPNGGAQPPAWGDLLPASIFAPVLDDAHLSDMAAKGPGVLPLRGSETIISVQPSEIRDASLFVECRYSGSLEDDDRSGAAILTETLKDCLDEADQHSRRVYDHFCNLLFRPTRAAGA